MNIKFNKLTLQCRKSREVINFSPQITFFHGPIATGKSSIARLIDFCLGGTLEKTPALAQELVLVQLSASIGDFKVLFERGVKSSNRIQVTWSDEEGTSESILIPISASTRKPIWGEEVYNLSDLIFHILGLSPIRIPRSRLDTESKLVRLSFRDILWYCYLEQEKLDSSFFRLEAPIIQRKSRYVMRYVVGDYTERLNKLEVDLSKVKETYKTRKEEATKLWSFLDKFGYGSEQEIVSEIDAAKAELTDAEKELSEIRKGYTRDTHLSDSLRDELRDLGNQLSNEEQIISDLNKRIEEQTSLKAELVLAKLNRARSMSAKSVLTGVSFEYCPACGTKVGNEQMDEDICQLCGKKRAEPSKKIQDLNDALGQDLDLRIEELEESLRRHNQAYKVQEKRVALLKAKKASLDNKLAKTLEVYDSNYLAASSELARKVATAEERLRSLNKILEMPKAVRNLEDQTDNLTRDSERLKREIHKERKSLEKADMYVEDIEKTFVQSLLAVNLPGISRKDKAIINRKKWMPTIIPDENDEAKWDFFNVGSAGKKTLFNVCYALSIHLVSAKHNLPLPTFLIIDTPMQHVGKDVNRTVFRSFYEYLYKLASGPLRETQFIIIDKEYFSPKEEEIEIIERLMTTTDEKYPPLISYYRG
jgi:hypothetical protein